jgi:methyl-accepting chemotaxis protein
METERQDPLRAYLLASVAIMAVLAGGILVVIVALGRFKTEELLAISAPVLIGCFCAGLILYLLLRRLVSNRLNDLSRFAHELAEGQLGGKPLPQYGEGPFRQLADSLNLVHQHSREAAQEISQASTKVRRSATNLASSAVEMNSASEEITATVQQISKGMETQAARTAETSQVMTEMSKNVSLMAEKSASVAEVSAQAWETALKGGESVKEAVKRINEIFNKAVESSKTVESLGIHSRKIGQVVSIITGIADQTSKQRAPARPGAASRWSPRKSGSWRKAPRGRPGRSTSSSRKFRARRSKMSSV